MSDFDFNLLEQIEEQIKENAERVGSYKNIGRLTVDFQTSVKEDGEWKDVDVATYMNAKCHPKRKTLTAVIGVETTEFDTRESAKDYIAYIQVDAGEYVERDESTGEVVNRYPSNWDKTVAPSILDVTGGEKALSELARLHGKYVETISVDSVPSFRDKVAQYKTPKFTRVFANREEALAAHNDLTGGNASNNVGNDEPSGWDADNYGSWEESKPHVAGDVSGKKGSKLIEAFAVWGLELNLDEAIKLQAKLGG